MAARSFPHLARLLALLCIAATTPPLQAPPVPGNAPAPAAAYPVAGYRAAAANDPAEILARYLRTLATNPRDLEALTGAGRAALDIGDANAALAFYARAEEIAPRDGRIKAGIASALVQLEKPKEAIRLFDEATDLGVPEADVARDRGLAWDLRGDAKRAQKDYALALQARNDDETVRRLALSTAISGDTQAGAALLDPLLRRNDRAAWRARAFILAMGGDTAAAETVARSAMSSAQVAALHPFLVRLAALKPAQKALAVHFGEMPADGRSSSPAELAALDGPAVRSPMPRSADELIPAGDPFAPRGDDAVVTRPAERLSSAPRRRPGENDVASVAPPPPKPVAVAVAVAVAPRSPSDGAAASAPGFTLIAPQPSVAPTPVVAAGPSAAIAPQPVIVVNRSAITPAVTPAPSVAAPSPLAAAPRPSPVEKALVPASAAVPAVASVRAAAPEAAATPSPEHKPLVVADRAAAIAPLAAPAPVAAAPVAPSPQPAPPLASAAATIPVVPSPTPSVPPLASSATIAVVPPPAPSTPPLAPVAATTVVPSPAPSAPPLASSPVAAPVIYSLPPKPLPSAPPLASSAAVAPVIFSLSPKPPPPFAAAESAAPVSATRAAAPSHPTVAEPSKPVLIAEKPAVKSTAKPAEKARAESADKAKPKPDARKGKGEAKPEEAAERLWVQVAGGATKADLPKAWAKLKGKVPTLAKGQSVATTPLRFTNRLLVGPFKSADDAQDYVNRMSKNGLSGFVFTSAKGQDVEKLSAAK